MGFFGARCGCGQCLATPMEKVMIELIDMGFNVLCPWGRWRLCNRQLNMLAAQSMDVICWRRLHPRNFVRNVHIAHPTATGPLSHCGPSNHCQDQDLARRSCMCTHVCGIVVRQHDPGSEGVLRSDSPRCHVAPNDSHSSQGGKGHVLSRNLAAKACSHWIGNHL